MEPRPRVFHMLQYFGTIFPSIESLSSSQQDEVKSKLSLRTPLYYEQFVWFQKFQKSYIPYLYYIYGHICKAGNWFCPFGVRIKEV